MKKPLIEVTAFWGNDDAESTIKVTEEAWQIIKAGGEYSTNASSYYDGKEYEVYWLFKDNILNIDGDDAPYVVGMDIDELILNANHDMNQKKRRLKAGYKDAVNDSIIEAYSELAKNLGITAEDLIVAGSAVSNFNVSEELVAYLLEHKLGPLLTLYLSKNLTVLDNLTGKSLEDAMEIIETTVVPDALKLRNTSLDSQIKRS